MSTSPDSPSNTPKTSNTGIIIGIVVAVLLGVVVIVGILAALAVAGFRNYMTLAKEAEGRSNVEFIARDVTRCAEREKIGGNILDIGPGTQELPPTSSAVPRALSDIAGRKYMSTPGDWTGPGWDCIKFSMRDPQYFQYQWIQRGPLEGVVRGVADFNGDGTPDITLEEKVTCTKGTELSCSASNLTEKR